MENAYQTLLERDVYFSELHDLEYCDDYEWFDPLLEADTQLFVDPFLIFQEEEEGTSVWSTAHDEIVQYFQKAFELLAGHQDRPNSIQYKKTVRLMYFPEPVYFGLGFTASSTRGSGTGKGFAELIVRAMAEAINRGLDNFKHFEELGLLVEGIGKDRISDITCNVLSGRFIRFTQEVCKQLAIPVQHMRLERGRYDKGRMAWFPHGCDLPKNPMSGEAVLLVPKRFLRQLPSLNADDWWEYVEPELRDDLNLAINERLGKRRIIRLARQHPNLIRRWSEARESRRTNAYPLSRDPEGLHLWQARGRAASEAYPLDFQGTPKNSIELRDFVREVVGKFKWQVEECGLWALLFNDDTGRPKRELSIQLLFAGLVRAYCDAHGVRVDREVQLGRGPVDFAFSGDQMSRVLLEIKKMTNSDYWHGLEAQLVSYLHSDQCHTGWFLAVRTGDSVTQKTRTSSLAERTRLASASSGFELVSEWVDARPKESASNLTPGDPGVKTSEPDDEFGE